MKSRPAVLLFAGFNKCGLRPIPMNVDRTRGTVEVGCNPLCQVAARGAPATDHCKAHQLAATPHLGLRCQVCPLYRLLWNTSTGSCLAENPEFATPPHTRPLSFSSYPVCSLLRLGTLLATQQRPARRPGPLRPRGIEHAGPPQNCCFVGCNGSAAEGLHIFE